MNLQEWFRTNENDAIRQSFHGGVAQGAAQSVLTVLAERGLAVSQQERERILTCEHAPTVDRWLKRALTATTTAEVLGG